MISKEFLYYTNDGRLGLMTEPLGPQINPMLLSWVLGTTSLEFNGRNKSSCERRQISLPQIVLNLCYSQNCSVSRELQQADNLNLVFSMVVSEHVMQMRFRVSQGSEVNLY